MTKYKGKEKVGLSILAVILNKHSMGAYNLLLLIGHEQLNLNTVLEILFIDLLK
jgi:hypothetical protein